MGNSQPAHADYSTGHPATLSWDAGFLPRSQDVFCLALADIVPPWPSSIRITSFYLHNTTIGKAIPPCLAIFYHACQAPDRLTLVGLCNILLPCLLFLPLLGEHRGSLRVTWRGRGSLYIIVYIIMHRYFEFTALGLLCNQQHG